MLKLLKIQPLGGHSSDGNFSLVHLGVLNRGRTCTDFRMMVEQGTIRRPLVESGVTHDFTVRIPFETEPGVRTYKATFVDALGNFGEQEVKINAVRAGERTVLRLVE